MGNLISYCIKDRSDEGKRANTSSADQRPQGSRGEAEMAKKSSYEVLKSDLIHRPHMFILNNAFLAVQFFKDFER